MKRLAGVVVLCSVLGAAWAQEIGSVRSVGRGGKIFEPTAVEELLARPYLEHVPMACTGECLWAAHPDGWAFAQGTHYYLLTPSGIGFDLQLIYKGTPINTCPGTAYPSHVQMDGGSGPIDVKGAKWITADDVLAVKLTLENTSNAPAQVEAQLVLPTKEVQSFDDNFGWNVRRHGLDIGLLGVAPGFVNVPFDTQAVSKAFVIEAEEPAAQQGSIGADGKSAASGGNVLGSNFGGAKGHFAEWEIPVAQPVDKGVLTFRYSRRAPGGGEFRVTVGGKEVAAKQSFKDTGGWGDSADDFKTASFDLGAVAAGKVKVRIEALEDGSNTNFDLVGIHEAGTVLPGVEPAELRKTRNIALEPGQKTNVAVYLAVSTDAQKRRTALSKISNAKDPLALQREKYVGWLVDNVPDFRSSDAAMTRQYWHRADSVLRKSLFKVGEGRLKRWAIAEGRWNSSWYPNIISYGAGHQVREARWLRDSQYVQDILATWCENERDNGIFPNYIRPNEIGDGQYTDWITSTAWDAFCVAPDAAKLREWADALKRNVDGWLKVYDPDNDGLLLVDSHWWTGMEWQPSFFYFTGFDKDKQEQHLERVDLTAYVYGDAKNLARILEVIGDTEGAAHYRGVAERIANATAEVMWDAESKFFYSVEPNDHRKSMVKEVVGVYPFYFSMFEPGTPYTAAWSSILDPEEFWTTWPVASATKKCPAYSQDVMFNGKEVGGCMWNGPTWPHANSIVLSAMAATLREFPESPLKVEDFHKLLHSFTMAQFLDQDLQFPWTGEYYNGENAKWRTPERDYDHSTYMDIIIADYAGLRPRADNVLELHPLLTPDTPSFTLDGVRYHGHDVTIAWTPLTDSTLAEDHMSGFRLYVDGKLRHRTDNPPAGVELPLG